MPISKNQLDRYYILDSIFHKWENKWYTQNELLNLLNQELEFKGWPEVSKRTLQNDINDMEYGECKVPIEKSYVNRQRVYRYSDPHFSLREKGLTETDKRVLKQAIDIIKNFEGNPCMEWIEDLSFFVKNESSMDTTRKIIGFEDNLDLKNRDLLHELFIAISSKTPLRIKYQPFNKSELLSFDISPLYLKQSNHQRWYLLTKSPEKDKIYVLSIDRIVSIQQQIEMKYEELDIDFDDYFYDIIGISHIEGHEVQRIYFWSDDKSYPYIETKPLHPTQRKLQSVEVEKLSLNKLTSFDSENGTFFSIDVAENYELYALMLSYGTQLRIVAPDSIKKEYISCLNKMMQLY